MISQTYIFEKHFVNFKPANKIKNGNA